MAEDVSVYGRETLTKLRWYSEADTMDEEELSRRKALEGVEGSRRIQAVERSLCKRAITPRAITPRAITPRAIKPRAIKPGAITSHRLGPSLYKPRSGSFSTLYRRELVFLNRLNW
jgi:hypothetical protein